MSSGHVLQSAEMRGNRTLNPSVIEEPTDSHLVLLSDFGTAPSDGRGSASQKKRSARGVHPLNEQRVQMKKEKDDRVYSDLQLFRSLQRQTYGGI